MTQQLTFSVSDVLPCRGAILRHQGVPHEKTLPPPVLALMDEAEAILAKTARPVGLFEELTVEEFADIYEGEGHNAPETPMRQIYPKADAAALFAVTLGAAISEMIESLFDDNALSLACMLDSAASVAAQNAASCVRASFVEWLSSRARLPADARGLHYCPGYCGWDISGQQRLFKRLNPEQIGLSLRETLLMEPMKSVSGVIIVGRAPIHRFAANYPFCEACQGRGCRERIRSVLLA